MKYFSPLGSLLYFRRKQSEPSVTASLYLCDPPLPHPLAASANEDLQSPWTCKANISPAFVPFFSQKRLCQLLLMDHDRFQISVLFHSLPFSKIHPLAVAIFWEGEPRVGISGIHRNAYEPASLDCNKELEINIHEIVQYSIFHLYIEIFNFCLKKVMIFTYCSCNAGKSCVLAVLLFPWSIY